MLNPRPAAPMGTVMATSSVHHTLRRIWGRLAAEAGTSLIEVVVAASLLAVVAVGVMSGLDVSARVSGDQKGKAVAGNIAEGELERIRGLDISQMSTLTGTPVTKTEGGVNYTVTSEADWVANQAGDSFSCSVEGGTTYLKLKVTVKWPGSDKPVVLESILAPGARNIVRTVGAMALRVVDPQQNPVSGVSFTLTAGGQSNRTGTTDSNGCVVWSTLPATTWQVTGTKTSHVTPQGDSSITDEISVPGQTFVTKEYEYAPGGTISGNFFTTRPGNATPIASAPQKYVIAHSSMNYQGNSYRVIDIPAGQTTFTTPALYPYGSPYTIWAGGCTTAPSAAGIATPTLPVGGNVSGVQVKLPALNIITKNEGSPRAGSVRTTICGTTYDRNTQSNGLLADPGFPQTSSASVCADVESDHPSIFIGWGWYRKTASWSNTNYNGTSFNNEYNMGWSCSLFNIFGVCIGTWSPNNGFGGGTC